MIRRDGVIPAKVFEDSLPDPLRFKLLRFTQEVANSNGSLGGGYFEPCHDYPGLFEVRVGRGDELARFLCARDGDTLILLGGVHKRVNEASPQSCFREASEDLTQYRETGNASP